MINLETNSKRMITDTIVNKTACQNHQHNKLAPDWFVRHEVIDSDPYRTPSDKMFFKLHWAYFEVVVGSYVYGEKNRHKVLC